jgi:hypothetical protein
LSFSPAAESLQETAETWIEAITPLLGNPIEKIDAPRLRASFLSLTQTSKKWPSPSDLIDHLPPRPQVKQLPPPPMSDEEQKRGLDGLAAMKRIISKGMTP